MKIALVGPTSMETVAPYLNDGRPPVACHTFPYIAALAVAYAASGNQVHIVCLSDEVNEVAHYSGKQIEMTLVPQRSSARARAFDWFSHEREGLAAALRSIEFDVIHAHWTYEYASASLDVDKTALVTCHDSPVSVLRYYHHPYWWFRELLSAITLRRAQNLTAVSPSLMQEVRPFIARNATIKMIPNGIETGRFTREKYRLDPHRPVFCTIANGFNSRKNSMVAIQAFVEARKHFPNAELLLIGEGHEPDGLARQWCERQQVDTSGVQFMGTLENSKVLQILSERVHIVLHMSRWEACCIAIMEAQNVGVAVIGGNKSGGVGYSLEYGKAGVLVNIRDSHAVFDEILNLLKNPSYYSEIVDKATRYLSQEFCFTEVVASYLSALESIRGVAKR